MKSLNKDVISESQKVGRNASVVAEAAQTDLAYKFAEILIDHPKSSADKAIDKMKVKTEQLLEDTLEGFPGVAKDINKNTRKLFKQSTTQAKTLTRIDSDNSVADYLYKITGNELLANQKVTYKNGRKVGFKEYTEMATRTRIQHELLKQEKDIGVKTKQLFYVCDTYSDCANDHQDYQGQLYYSEKVWKSIPLSNKHYATLQRAVKRCKTSVEDVTENAPWLTTRPNCRHRLIPIAIDDVVTLNKDKILETNKADKGNYSKSVLQKNYKDSQTQRRVELGIRTSKRNTEIMQKAYKKNNDPEFLNAINKFKRQTKVGQNNMRKLVKYNITLKRDYRRENPYHLQKDLGVAYVTEPVRATFKIPDTELVGVKNNKEFIEKSKKFQKSLTADERDAINTYSSVGGNYRYMNMAMYDRKGMVATLKEKSKEHADANIKFYLKYAESLHDLFKKNHVKSEQAMTVYRGADDLVGEDDTTIIFNGFTSTSSDRATATYFKGKKKGKAMYKIIIPPEAQNQALYIDGGFENETLIDTNSVYDIVGEKQNEDGVKQYTLLLRPKHKGVER